MRRITITAAVLFAFLAGLLPAEALAASGKEVFLDKKCDGCHSIKAENVEKQVSKSGKKKKGPDLSGAGAEHDAAWIKKWLNKDVKKKSVYSDKEVKHKKKWNGSDADLDTLATFLTGLKTKVDVADEGDEDSDE